MRKSFGLCEQSIVHRRLQLRSRGSPMGLVMCWKSHKGLWKSQNLRDKLACRTGETFS